MDLKIGTQGGVQPNFDEVNKSNSSGDSYEIVVEKTVATKVASEQKPSEEDVKKAVQELNKVIEKNGTYAEYEVHKAFGDIMIRIHDSKTKEVIQEFPPKKILDMIESLCRSAGILVDKKA
ncbi:MAG: flagellar protein FlaG [Clostridiaceae bacterium]